MTIIGSIKFSLFSPNDIRKMSTTRITVPDTYDEDGYPIVGGLADQRLGVIDPGLKCKSCGSRMKDCPGHFGHIELVRPVVHVGFAKTVYQLLKATCRKCGRLMVLADLEKTKQSNECPHCGEKQKKVKFVKPTGFFEDDRKVLPNELRERLERIPQEDLDVLKVKIRPEWVVLTVLIVPPVTVRPSITLETGERSEDDLTHKLVDILRINQRLEENVEAGAPQLIIEDLWELLQYHVSTYFDNETAGIPPARHRSGRQLKTLFQRLKGKEGRFRYNLSGKRVNFSARTVISPDPTLGINELGVPDEIASELTVPISVTEWNLENVKILLKEKMDKISYVVRPDGRRKKLSASNLDEVLGELAPGYFVERQLIDGDFVLFNRQPSLHRVSMMCHRVRVLPGKTFRFNVAVCNPYNADYDGDEMNMHVPQNEEAQSEAALLMSVKEQILSPRKGFAIIAPSLDHITGLYLLTQDEVSWSREEACTLLNEAGITNENVNKTISGKDLFSMILPPELNFECINKSKEKVVIKKGKLVSGHIDGKVSTILVEEIFKKLGSEAASDYLDRTTKLSVAVTTFYGFSLSMDDYKITPKAKEEITQLYEEGRKKVRELIKLYRTGKLERKPGKTLKETLEEQVMSVVELIRFHSWSIVKDNIKLNAVVIGGKELKQNSALLMASSGARGKPINVVQMTSLVGQQAVRGKRMTAGFRNRILPHFLRGDLSDSSRGFVKNNYVDGLTAFEYFFHAAGGRDSVVDKGVNPAKTGYMQRRLINAFQDFFVDSDYSVRDAEGNLIQFLYGDDGNDPCTNEAIAPGEPVGVVAAQSIGEPGTQMTLRTFHYAGVASLAQLGFTRLVELVDARRTPKKPVMEIHLQKKFQKDYDAVKKIASSIEQVTLRDIAEIKEDFIKKVVTITFNKQLMREKNIKEKEIIEKIKELAEFSVKDDVLVIKPKNESLKNIRLLTTKMGDLHLQGISGISRAIIVESKKDQGIELTIATEGSNLKEVFKIPEVDSYFTTTNDVKEIAEVLGIEAGRNSIIQEVMKVLDAQDLDVDLRHIMLIADAMAFKGAILSVGRHGLAGKKASVIARAAFEETAKHLLNACVHGEVDNLSGVAENIIVGQTIPCGTGKVNLEYKP
ncbi:MAG: DNA-directed RNA polymerase subunit A' [Candidatus Micrarchaeota archaeon]